MSPPDAGMLALRTACAVARMDHVHALELTGAGALELLDAATTSRLFVRESQLLQTLMLDEQGLPFADAMVGLDEEAWLLLVEGPSLPALLQHLPPAFAPCARRRPRSPSGICAPRTRCGASTVHSRGSCALRCWGPSCSALRISRS